jgi:DNA-binding NarL/FixJ family response regulator
MRVLLVDDHALFLEGLANLLAAHGVVVVGTASDGLEALAKVRGTRLDVVLMDLRMPRCDGLQATRMIKAECPKVKVIMLTVSDEDGDLIEAIRSGASGYLLKSADAREFFDALERVRCGEAALSHGLTGKVFEALLHEHAHSAGPPMESAPGLPGLSARQMQVLTLATQGLTYGQIGMALCLSEHTVKYHFQKIFVQLGLENREQVVSYAWRTGLIDRT